MPEFTRVISFLPQSPPGHKRENMFFLFLLLESVLADLTLRMPNVHPRVPETYLCHPVRLNETLSVVGTRTRAPPSTKTAHHLLLYGCRYPALSADVFHCGEMAVSSNGESDDGLPRASSPCYGGDVSVIYAWAKNAPELKLPEGVAFKVGGVDTSVEWLVLQAST